MRGQAAAAFFFILLLALPFVSAAACTAADTPLADLNPAAARVALGTTLDGTFTVGNNVSAQLGFTPLTPERNITFDASSGAFSFTPSGAENATRILFYAVSPDGCVATRLATYAVLKPPAITATPIGTRITIPEARATLFSATASGAASTEWLLDGAPVNGSNESFLYVPDYNAAGSHNVTFEATSTDGITASEAWNVTVTNVNRPPVQVATIMPVLLPVGGDYLLNLSAYFMDPDKGPLAFTAMIDEPPAQYVAPANVTVIIDGSDAVVTGNAPGKSFVRFAATDNGNASVESPPVMYIVSDTRAGIPSVPYCGDKMCLAPENCSTCSKDCGGCEATTCTPQWNCTDWGDCLPGGYQYRNCTVVNGCENATVKPPMAQTCDYAPTCFDGIRNGNESGVDCGGPCGACPSCSDAVRNQGESGIDCGGPCGPCPSCSDGIRNQGESDVDCGGPCGPCAAGERCMKPTDCGSLSCVDRVCAQPNCSDGVRNQGESGIDCGGPCAACPTCSDGVRNQGEILPDCGGPCRACALHDYAPIIIRWTLLAAMALLLLGILYFLRAILTSRLLFLLQNRKTIHFFYEDAPTYALVRSWNSFARHFRFDRHKAFGSLVDQTYNEVVGLRRLPPEALRPALIGRLRGLYAALLDLSPGFEYDLLLYSLKRARLPFAVKVILLRNTKTLSLIELTQLYSDPGFALEDVLRGLGELKKAF